MYSRSEPRQTVVIVTRGATEFLLESRYTEKPISIEPKKILVWAKEIFGCDITKRFSLELISSLQIKSKLDLVRQKIAIAP